MKPKCDKDLQDELFKAVREEVAAARKQLGLPPAQDKILSRLEYAIWARQRAAINLPPSCGYVA